MNKELSNLEEWLKCNKLSLNIAKTNYMIITKKKLPTVLSDLYMYGDIIDRKRNVKFLGLLIDDDLNWHAHISHVKSKITSSLYAMYCAKEHLITSHLKQLYYSLIYPYLIYGILIWGSAAYFLLRKLEVLQKRAIRLIANAPQYAHAEQYFKALSLLKLQDIMKLFEGKYMFKQVHDLLPKPLLRTFTHNLKYTHTIPDILVISTNFPLVLLCLPKASLCLHLTTGLCCLIP